MPIACGADPGEQVPAVRGAGPAAADAAVPGGLAPRHRTRAPARRPPTTRTTTRTRPTRTTSRIGGCARPGAARTPPTCPGCRWRTARSAGCSRRPDGKTYRPSMFITLTLPVLRAGRPARACRSTRPATTTGGPRSTRSTSRSWSTGSGRTCAAAPATRSSTSPPSKPSAAGAPHLHAAVRGRDPPPGRPRGPGRHLPPGLVAGPRQAVYDLDRLPVLDRRRRRLRRPDTGAVLPTWDEALDAARRRPRRRAGARGAVRGPGRHQGPDRRHARSGPGDRLPVQVPDQGPSPAPTTTRRRLATRGPRTSTAWPKKSAGCRARRRCANWLRYGVQPEGARAGMVPGPLPPHKAHDRGEPRARRPPRPRVPAVVRQDPRRPQGRPGRRRAGRPRGSRHRPRRPRRAVDRRAPTAAGPGHILARSQVDERTYAEAIAEAIDTRQRWRREYEAAKERAGPPAAGHGERRARSAVRQRR